ncbi:MAG: response regulator [Bacteroidetes bacterium]|jgi:DNA-binding LytR/AlgR family response regulator|nr:response regulator [Bacteroidota bacterium]
MTSEEHYTSATVLLVDDNPSFVELISILLHDIGITSVTSACSFEEGVEAFADGAPDVCIFDIDLGRGKPDGIDLAEHIRLTAPAIPIIFITANYTEEFYERCRHVQPSCFMNKELSRFKLRQAIDLTILNCNAAHNTTASHPPRPQRHEPPYVSDKNYFFKIGDAYKKISVEDIAFFYAKDKLVYARSDSRSFPTTTQLKTLEKELPANFQRIHKTYLINIDYIEQIKTKEDVVIIDNEALPMGYTYKKEFLDKVHILK